MSLHIIVHRQDEGTESPLRNAVYSGAMNNLSPLGSLIVLLSSLSITQACAAEELGPPAPLPSLTEQADSLKLGQVWFGKRVVVDTWDIVTSPLDWDGRSWGVAGLAVGSVVVSGLFLDKAAQSESQESRTSDKDRWSGTWGELGTVYSVAVLGAAGAYGWIADDERGVNVMIDGLESTVIASGILCPLLKYTVGRARPNETAQDSDVFAPFSGAASFPSGHTTQAFTIASVLAFSFDDQPVVGGLAFATAAGVGLSRINNDAHYVSDVVAGAILGTWVGYEVVHYNRRRRGEEVQRSRAITDATMNVIFDGDRKGISLTWHW